MIIVMKQTTEQRRRYTAAYNKKHPEKVISRKITERAIQEGYLIPMSCEFCGSVMRIEVHHEDYSKPYDVRWLCRYHHLAVHHHKLKLLSVGDRFPQRPITTYRELRNPHWAISNKAASIEMLEYTLNLWEDRTVVDTHHEELSVLHEGPDQIGLQSDWTGRGPIGNIQRQPVEKVEALIERIILEKHERNEIDGRRNKSVYRVSDKSRLKGVPTARGRSKMAG